MEINILFSFLLESEITHHLNTIHTLFYYRFFHPNQINYGFSFFFFCRLKFILESKKYSNFFL